MVNEELNPQEEQPRGDKRVEMVDQLGTESAREVIREALEHAGVESKAEDWTARRDAFLVWLNAFEAQIDRELSRAA